jgi:hypothetical protein
MQPQNVGNTQAAKGRSPVLAAILSGLFPGLGQWYNRQLGKAFLFLVAGVVTGFGPLSPLDVDIDLDNPVAGLHKVLLASLPFLAIALWAVVDAYRSARHLSHSRE